MTTWMRSKRISRDALALAGPMGLSEAKQRIDASVQNQNLKALRYWTDVWFRLQQLQMSNG
jgi:hypothetical protein